MKTLRYEDLNSELLRRIPELKGDYREEFSYWENLEDDPPGPHVVYGDLLTLYMISLLLSGKDRESLDRIFGLLEDMAKSEDVEVRNVLTDTVGEYLVDREEPYSQAKKIAGPQTRILLQSVET